MHSKFMLMLIFRKLDKNHAELPQGKCQVMVQVDNYTHQLSNYLGIKSLNAGCPKYKRGKIYCSVNDTQKC